jgi:hypothetical protein
VATFNADSIELDECTTPKKRAPLLIHNMSTDLSADLPPGIGYGLLDPIYLACDQYVQYLLTGTNPSVLN